jgi:hypothetical protein
MKALALALLLVAPLTMAQPGSGSCQQHPDAPYCQGGGGTGGDSTGEGNENTNTNDNTSNSQGIGVGVGVASSDSNSDSRSYASGGSVRSDIDVSGGESSSSSNATVGDVSASGGDSRAYGGVGVGGNAEGGKSEASSGGNTQDITVEGDTDNSQYSYKESEQSAASAASVFAGYCQSGASGQLGAGGFSVVNPEAFCNNVRMAGVYQEAYAWELKHGKITCASEASGAWIDDQMSDTCVNEQAATYYKLYNWHLDEAHELLESTKGVAKVDAFAGYLIRPAALLALLFLL